MKNIYKEILPTSTCSISSNTEFINKLKEIEVNKEDHLVSFDVKELFPSIAIREINQIIQKRIEAKYGLNKISETLSRANNLILN